MLILYEKTTEMQISTAQLISLTAVSGVGSSPALAACETSQLLLAGVSGGFPVWGTPVSSHQRLARLDMSEIILKGTLN